MPQAITETEAELLALMKQESEHGKRSRPPIDHISIARSINKIVGYDPFGTAYPDKEKVVRVAALCNKSTNWVRFHLRLLGLSPEALQLVEIKTKEGVGFSTSALAEIAETVEPQRQPGLVDGLSKTYRRWSKTKCT
jgi:hypothetical protein